jgi:hypothetical protein
MGSRADLAPRWRMGAPVVVRRAGVPVSAVLGLGGGVAVGRARVLAAERAWLADEGAALSDALFEVVGAVGGSSLRPRLVGLRRALHDVRTPTGQEWHVSVRPALPVELAERIRQWKTRLSRWQQESRGLAGVLVEDREREQAWLREALRHPGLQRALSQAVPTLLDGARRWAADENHHLKRQKVVRLAKFVARAAVKTSPYGFFLLSGFARWCETGPAVRLDGPAAGQGVLEPDGFFVAAVRAALLRRPELEPGVRIRVNPSATEAAGRMRFFGAPPLEPLVTLAATPAVRRCLWLAEDRPTVVELRTRLAAESGEPPARVTAFVDRLVESGLLEAYLPVPDQAEDWFGEVQWWIAEHAGSRLCAVEKLLGRVRDELRRDIPLADVDGDRTRRQVFHDAVRELAEALDLDSRSTGVPPGSPARETAVARGPLATCAWEHWRPALDDLDVCRRFLSVFDLALPARLALGAFVRESFGSGARVGFDAVHRAVQEELARERRGESASTDAAADLRTVFGLFMLPEREPGHEYRLPRLRHLDRLREQAEELFQRPPDPDGVVRVEPAELAVVAARLPEWVPVPVSSGCYVQVRRREADGGLQLVLNVVGRGHGHGVSRVRRLVEQAGGNVPWVPVPAEELLAAELSGTFGAALNLRARAAPYEIDYPFTVSDRPEPERIPVADLVVEHEPRSDLVHLRSARLDARVLPLHLGTLMVPALPPAARLLTLFTDVMSLHAGRPPAGSGPESAAPPEVVHEPRVEVGRVVVRRARWTAPTGRIPVRAGNETEAGHLLRLVDWLSRHGVPERCFVRAGQPGGRALLAKSHKPLYVDFTSSLLRGVFDRAMAGSAYVEFDEALPDPDEAFGDDAATAHVTEFRVEITDDGQPG